jgi:hypothetical protein
MRGQPLPAIREEVVGEGRRRSSWEEHVGDELVGEELAREELVGEDLTGDVLVGEELAGEEHSARCATDKYSQRTTC